MIMIVHSALPRTEFLGVSFANIDRAAALAKIFHGHESSPLLVVTPNAQHVVTLNKDQSLRSLYLSADLILNDSRVVALLARLAGIQLSTVTGSDLTAVLLPELERRGAKVLIIGPVKDDGDVLKLLYPRLDFQLISPGFGLRNNIQEQESIIKDAVCSDVEFILVCLGFPLQEAIARRIADLLPRRCSILCVGGSIDFLTGRQRRAPKIVQNLHLEWLFRLSVSPQRMWRRYFLESAPVLLLWVRYMARLSRR